MAIGTNDKVIMLPDVLDKLAEDSGIDNLYLSKQSAKDLIVENIPTYFDYIIVMSCTLVSNERRLIEAITTIFDVQLDSAKYYDTDQKHVFIIGVNFKDETRHINIQKVYEKLKDNFNRALVNGFINIEIYSYPSLFCHPNNHIEVEKSVFQEIVSQNMPLRKTFLDAIVPITMVEHRESSILIVNLKELHFK